MPQRVYTKLTVLKRTTKYSQKAFQLYQTAAINGDPVSMFIMGEMTRNAGDKYLAAYWYGYRFYRRWQTPFPGYFVHPSIVGEWRRNGCGNTAVVFLT